LNKRVINHFGLKKQVFFTAFAFVADVSWMSLDKTNRHYSEKQSDCPCGQSLLIIGYSRLMAELTWAKTGNGQAKV